MIAGPGGGPGGPGGFGGGPPGGSSVFRVYRYAADHPAFAGKDLKPGKTLADIAEAEANPPRSDKPDDKRDAKDR